jgi:hypothetical protein
MCAGLAGADAATGSRASRSAMTFAGTRSPKAVQLAVWPAAIVATGAVSGLLVGLVAPVRLKGRCPDCGWQNHAWLRRGRTRALAATVACRNLRCRAELRFTVDQGVRCVLLERSSMQRREALWRVGRGLMRWAVGRGRVPASDTESSQE